MPHYAWVILHIVYLYLFQASENRCFLNISCSFSTHYIGCRHALILSYPAFLENILTASGQPMQPTLRLAFFHFIICFRGRFVFYRFYFIDHHTFLNNELDWCFHLIHGMMVIFFHFGWNIKLPMTIVTVASLSVHNAHPLDSTPFYDKVAFNLSLKWLITPV